MWQVGQGSPMKIFSPAWTTRSSRCLRAGTAVAIPCLVNASARAGSRLGCARDKGAAAQAVCPVVLGRPDDEYQTMIDLSRACFDAILHQMKPGVTFGLLFDVYRDTVERIGKGKYLWNHPVMHARGLGDDGPALLGDSDLERFSKIEVRAGMTFILKPQVRPKEGKGRGSIGDTVAVTEHGARRLGMPSSLTSLTRVIGSPAFTLRALSSWM